MYSWPLPEQTGGEKIKTARMMPHNGNLSRVFMIIRSFHVGIVRLLVFVSICGAMFDSGEKICKKAKIYGLSDKENGFIIKQRI